MGQVLSEPVTAKETSALQNEHYKVGSSCMQGWRLSMEDAHTHILRLNEESDTAFFGVYDGHGGSKISNHTSKYLHKYIVGRPEYKEKKYVEALQQGFLECDAEMRVKECLRHENSGSTAIIALIHDAKDLYVGNLGDSRCIASINGITESLSKDHKPDDPLEQSRIKKAGGYVECSRVNGNLALSRAFGDYSFKNSLDLPSEEQIVSGFPDIVSKTITSEWEFIVLACDGIWDVLQNEDVTEFVIRRIAKNMDPEDICEELMTRCLSTNCSMVGLGCDNMSVILVCFLHDKSYSELVEKCKKHLEKFDAEIIQDTIECKTSEDDHLLESDSSPNSSPESL